MARGDCQRPHATATHCVPYCRNKELVARGIAFRCPLDARYRNHSPFCAMELGKPSTEGTAAVLVECNCGQRAREYEEIRKLLNNQYGDMHESNYRSK